MLSLYTVYTISDTFENILVKDDRLGCITPKVKFQVFKGGQNITGQPYKAISETTANHVYNVTVPSLETIISREVLWRSTVTLKISYPDKGTNEFAVNYGVTDALAPFPLHSLVNVMTVTINNNTVSQNMQETLPHGVGLPCRLQGRNSSNALFNLLPI